MNSLMNIVAVLVAIIALYVAWDQARIGRNQQHADVVPLLKIGASYFTAEDDDAAPIRRFRLTVVNAGVGPAYVDRSEWTVAGTSLQRASDFLTILPEALTPTESITGTVDDYLLGAGEKELVVEVVWPRNEPVEQALGESMPVVWRMDFNLCYCSIYERCWVSSFNAAQPRPVPVKQC